MPNADFTKDYSSSNGRSNFPRLRLQKNEIARVCIVGQPRYEHVHWLEAPQIVNMAPTYKKITNRDGDEQVVPNTRKVSQPICHGHKEILRDRGVDAEHCYACLMARDRPDIFRPPTTRFALNIIRYGLRPGGGWQDISMPFSIGSLLWAFSGKVMDKFIMMRSMGPQYEDLRMVDLLLACEDQNFQKPYSSGEFTPITPAVWTMSEQFTAHTVQYLEQNHASVEDLDAAIGKLVDDKWLQDDIQRVIQGWDVVRAYESRTQGGPQLGQGFGTETFQQGMANVQQQWAPPQQNGFQPQQFNGTPPPPPPPPQQPQMQPQGAGNGYAPTEQLWEPQWQQPTSAPPPPPQTAPPAPDAGWQPPPPALPPEALPTASSEAGVFRAPDAQPNPSAAAALAGMGGAQPSNMAPPTPQVEPGQPTPSQEPGPPQQPPANPSANPQSPQPIQRPDPTSDQHAAQPMQPPPSGLEGLNEFMRTTTSNPEPGPIPPLPQGAGQPAAAPEGGHYTFEQLVKLGKQAQGQ
jgi:hypothetical protein